MATVQVDGLKSVQDFLAGMGKQVRFASAQAINDTALDVQRNTTDKLLPSKFTLRSKGAPWQKPGTKMGFNIQFANKNKLHGEIGSAASWLTLQESGGTKKVDAHQLAIGNQVRPSKTSVIPRKFKPRNLIKNEAQRMVPGVRLKQKAFVVMTKKGFRAIMQRDGKSVKPLWSFKPSARIKPVLTYHKTGEALVLKNFEGHFANRFAMALLTAR